MNAENKIETGENVNKSYGYIRVSTKDQNLDRQRIALADLNVSGMIVFEDKQSGKDFNRPNYIRMIKHLREGDTLYITSIDRLGRDYDEILEQWRIITKEKKVNIVVLDMPLLDTRAKGKDLTGTFVSDLVLQILSYVAETERQNIRKRQAEGIAAAKARGVQFGRKRKTMPDNFETVVHQWRQEEVSLKTALSSLGVSRTYFFTYAKKLGV